MLKLQRLQMYLDHTNYHVIIDRCLRKGRVSPLDLTMLKFLVLMDVKLDYIANALQKIFAITNGGLEYLEIHIMYSTGTHPQ